MRLFWKKCLSSNKSQEFKSGAILDAVISESSAAASNCLLYKLADFKRGGDLIDALNVGGLVAVEQLIREQFGIFMYNNGNGQLINRAEFLRWKYRDHKQVTIPIEASLSIHDPLGKWQDHEACWQMQYRGALGESLLHVLIICDSNIHTKLARILLRVFPRLALDVMEGEEYLGASALHLAIAYNNNELVADLIECGADINQRAVGSFFLPRDQQQTNPAKYTDYEGLAYMGEYPLAWAACCANESVYNLLIDHGADPDAQDSFGNMILHMVVVGDKLDMFGYALRHPKTPAKNGMANHAGLTPLTLACKLGRAEVFREMLELSAREFWRYSNITCSGYPLNALDTLLPDGRTNWNSALFIILNGTKPEHLDMLDGGIIQRLLEEKWKTFAQNQFLKRLLILMVHLFCLSVSVYMRPANGMSSDNDEEHDNNNNHDDRTTNPMNTNRGSNDDGDDDSYDVHTIIRYVAELATIIGVLCFLIFQQGHEIRNQGLSAYLNQLPHAPAKFIFLISNLLILACIPYRLMGDKDTEEAILIFAVPGSWFLLMFFAGAIRLTGPFVTMIYSMITGDLFTFGIIYSIVLCGFSQAFYFLYKGHPQLQSTMFNTFSNTWMALFQTTLGDYNYPDLNNTTYPNLSKTVFVMFMIFVPILLLNMLIAMMGNTYAHVIEQSEKEWMKQWAKIVVTLERAVTQTDAKSYLEAYSIPLGPSDDSGFEVRGVMVIKSKSKTRAKQRKGAVSNWKRVGRVTLNALKQRGMTGEQMRRLMWGRASISSPERVAKKKLQDPYNLQGYPSTAAVDMLNFTGTDTTMIPGTTSMLMHSKQYDVIHDEDPLRDLMILIETNPTLYQTGQEAHFNVELKRLANRARELVEGHEMRKPPITATKTTSTTSTIHTATTTTTTVTADTTTSTPAAGLLPTNLTNIFQDQKDYVDPEKLKQFLKLLSQIESDENENDDTILGKLSLARRTKSALFRSQRKDSINEIRTDDMKPTSTGKIISVADDDDDVPYFDFKSALDKEQREKQRQKQDESNGCADDNNDIDNDNNDEDDDYSKDLPTEEEVRDCMRQFHMRKAQGVKKVKSAPPPLKRRNKISPECIPREFKSQSEEEKKSPPTSDEKQDTKEGEEAVTDDAVDKDQEIPATTDPLEPWSTRELHDINEILGTQ